MNVILWIWTGRRFGFTSAPSSSRHREQIRSTTSGTGTGTIETPFAWRSPRSLDSDHIPLSPSTPRENNGGGGGFYSFVEGAGVVPVFPAEYRSSLSGSGSGVGVYGADSKGVGSRRR